MTPTALNRVVSFTSVVCLLLVWQLYSIQVDNATLMPSVLDVFDRLIYLLSDLRTYQILATSVLRLLLSLSIAVVFGMTLGLLSGVNQQLEAFMHPIVVSIRTLPVISIIIVFLILFGNTITLYLIVLLLLFPIIYQAVMDGVKQTDPLLVDVVRLDSTHSNLDVLRLVYLPLSIPHLRTALIDAVGLGFKVLIIAEFFAQTKISIGREIYVSRANLAFSNVFAWTLLLLFFVLIMNKVVHRILSPNIS